MSLFRSHEPSGVRVNTRTGPGSAPFTGPAWGAAAVFLVIALLLQTEVLHYFSFRGAVPSLVLIAVVWYALRANLFRAAVFGLIAGICEDALSAQTGASWTISTMATAFFAGALSRWFFADSAPVMASVVFIATLLRRLIFWVVMSLSGYPAGYASLHFHQALWEALMNAILVGVATLAARRFERRAYR